MPLVEPTATKTSELFPGPRLSKSGGRAVVDDPRWLLAQRISISKSIGRSPLLSDFLLYVCDRHIRNRSSELTEQQIGVHVFGRREGYNSNDDNIVRNYARTLRKRIDEYFATKGKHEELIMEIPRGAYVPVFSSTRYPVPMDHALSHAREPYSIGALDITSSQTAPEVQEHRENDLI